MSYWPGFITARKALTNGKRIIGMLTAAFMLVVVGGYWYYCLPHDGMGRKVRISVHRGDAFSEISRRLAEKGLIRFPEVFTVLARLEKRDIQVKAGEYSLDSSLSPKDILGVLCRGQVNLRKVTVPEGMTVEQIALILETAGLADCRQVLDANADPGFIDELGVEGGSLEGYLFPDTYHFAEGISARRILRAMVRRFWEVYGPQMAEKQESQGLTRHETVTMASIVEKETARGEERPLIASVIRNRLKARMPLQCDPTVIYGIKDFDGNLTRKQLATPNPYNTYVIRGLPPGPICNPGLDSLMAVLNPENTRYLYFVSRNDGSHQFSERLTDHNGAVQRYQKGCRP